MTSNKSPKSSMTTRFFQLFVKKPRPGKNKIDNSSSSSSSSSNAKMRWFRTQHTEAPRLLSLSPLRTDADENPEVASPRLLAVSKLRGDRHGSS
uniref:Uncharacterized protein n=1 Tax=Trichogramma kaykai TaxID=54128 RepID=A0ABD2XPS1_9HYME